MPTSPVTPEDPDSSGKPPDPWAPPAPFVTYEASDGLERTSRIGPVLVGCFGFLVLALVSTALHLVPAGSGVASGGSSGVSPSASAELGDCVKLTGVRYDEVACEAGAFNYTVSKVLGSQDEKCGDNPDAYVKHHGHAGRESVCLLPVFADGECYTFTSLALDTDFQKAPCGGPRVVRVKLLPHVADATACGPSAALALAYPEVRITYCLTASGR